MLRKSIYEKHYNPSSLEFLYEKIKVIRDCHRWFVGLCVLQRAGKVGRREVSRERCNQEEYPSPGALPLTPPRGQCLKPLLTYLRQRNIFISVFVDMKVNTYPQIQTVSKSELSAAIVCTTQKDILYEL